MVNIIHFVNKLNISFLIYRKANFDGILGDAKTRLESLVQNNFANIAKELRDQDHYQFSRAYSPGLQEFVEALTYYFYMSGDKWENWYDLQARLTYQNTVTEAVANDDADELLTAVNKILLSSGETKMASETIEKKSSPAVLATVTDTCLVQPIEFFLGLADLGGELMRRCINSLGCGDVDVCMNASKFLQGLYTCYLSLGNTRNKEMGRKIHTLRQSVLKAENVCYNIKVRGGEAAVWGSDDPLDKAAADDDEGFANY